MITKRERVREKKRTHKQSRARTSDLDVGKNRKMDRRTGGSEDRKHWGTGVAIDPSQH